MSEPFFSVLLPTKNRSEIVGGAIESILRQDFTDFEVVVSDNDDSPTATRDAVSAFQDPRVRYVRTRGDLAMHENWENARREARGQWVLVVEDKQRLTPTALRTLHQVCIQHPGAIVSYPPVLAFTDALPGPSGAPRCREFTCEEVVDEFCRFTPTFWDIFPRGLTSVTRRDLLDRIAAEGPTGMVFSWVNPDYAYGFQALSRAEKLVYVAEDIIYVPHSVGRAGKYSNGLAATKKEAPARRFFASLPVTEAEIVAQVPVKSLWLWANPVLFDFYKFYRREGHRPKVDLLGYYAQCYHIILVGVEWGADMRVERQAVWDALRREGVWMIVRVFGLVGYRSARGLCLRWINRLRQSS